MKNLIQAAAITLFAASTVHAQQAVQWRVQAGGNGHWYQLIVAGPISWHAAKVATESRGGHLATLTSYPEKHHVKSVVAATPGFGESAVRRWGPWLGGKQDRSASDYSEPFGGWRWVTGEPWSYAAWNPFQPDNWCAESQVQEDFLTFAGYFLQSDGAWNDLPATGCDNDPVVSFVTEWSADCNNDGIVDYGQCRDGSLPDYNGNNIPDCCENGTPCVVGNYPVQWRVEDSGNGRWYQVMTYAVSPSWESARGDARSMGGDLTSFQSLAEMDFCLRLAEQRPMAWRRLPATGAWWGPWVGAFQEPEAAEPAGGWKWLDSPGLAFVSENRMTFNNQASCCGGNEDRLFMYANGPAVRFEFLELNDIPETGSCQGDCSHGPMVFSSVIEWSADCNGDGIVDKGQILRGQLPDANNNGIPDGCEQPTCQDADLVADGFVNGADLGMLLGAWGTVNPTTPADINHDGNVDGVDLGSLLGFWGPCP